ncbi:MAG: ankyrin repeat domain-containing protein [Lentisphaeria bacterium]|nr:ankyrin repeat domain-containing protein [Lentisphaeria bacterium]
MANIQCKMCGGVLDLPEGLTYAECPYCGSATTFPKLEDTRKEGLYNRAESLRHSNDFDKALQTYEKILEVDDSDPEIYWGMVLCRFGIEYVQDPATGERIPTCHRVQLESILQDSDYRAALACAGGNLSVYENEAKKIADIQKNILAVSAQEQPFDIFICYKESTDAGSRTKDSVVAQDIYYQLTNEGYRVFFARITLEDKIGQQYEPYIFAALNSARVMLVIGSKKEYFEAVWVKNEWSRFLSLMKKDRSKLLIPCYKDMDAYDIPEELSMLQSQDMSKIGFVQDLLRGIKKVCSAKTESSTPSAKGGNSPDTAGKIANLLKRAQIEKELENYDEVRRIGEQIINLDVDNVDGWYLQACCINNRDRAEKIFERLTRLKPDRAEYHISAGKELALFVPHEKHIEQLENASQKFLDAPENDDDKELEALENCFDECVDDAGSLEKCLEYLRNVIDDRIPGVKFSESEKEEAKEIAADVLGNLLQVMEYLRDMELYDRFYEEKYAREAIEKIGSLVLLRSRYSSDSIGNDTLMDAIEYGNMEIVEKFIDDGGKLDSCRQDDFTPLGLAILCGHDNIARYLVERGADVNALNSENQTALHLVLSRKQPGDIAAAVKFLLDNGANIHALDADGDTPLSLAFALDNITITPEILDMLIQAGADPNHTAGKYTPLITVAQRPDKSELLRVLLENGADFMITSATCGGTPMDYARGAQNIDFLSQVECPRMLNFDPIAYDQSLEEQQEIQAMKSDAPFQIKEFTLGSYIYSEISGVIRPLGFMSDDDKANCPLGASMKVTNTSGAVIKYIHLELQPYNDVEDPMADSEIFSFTGPLKPGQSQSFRIEDLDFPYVDCSNIGDLLVIGAQVEFMDGSTKTVSGEAILLEKAGVSGAQVANGLLEAGKLVKGIFDLFS